MTALAALRPAQAKAPAAAPAPVVAQALESLQQDSGPVSSLSRIPLFAPPAPPPPPSVSRASGEAVQRKCETCEAEENDEGTKVRARLEVGAADDPFEHEADAIAHSVMTIPESVLPGSAQAASGAMPLVRRACLACSATRDDQLSARRIDALSADMDESEAPRMRSEAESDGAPGLAATSGELTTGGSPLSASARHFFEPRMGRDLSHVRVHSGHASSGLSHSIGARAFTYRNHIWLGRSERHEISFTMAHELAHVLQQTAPGPVGPGTSLSHHSSRMDSGGAVRRAIDCRPTDNDFFFPNNREGTADFHDEAVQAASRNSNMRGEVRVPNAKGTDDGMGGSAGFQSDPARFGYADLVEANSRWMVGIGFEMASISGEPVQPDLFDPSVVSLPWHISTNSVRGRFSPVNLGTSNRHYYNGRRYNAAQANAAYERGSAPRWDASVNDFSRVIRDAPTSLKIGDMKFAGGRDRASDAVEQVGHYTDGFEFARDRYNDLQQRDQLSRAGSNSIIGRSGRTLRPWTLSVGATDSSSGPTDWQRIGGARDLIVGKWTRRLVPAPDGTTFRVERCENTDEYSGYLYYRNNPATGALWDYIFWPASSSRRFDAREQRLIARYTSRATDLRQEATRSPGNRVRRLPDHQVLAGKRQKATSDQNQQARAQRRARPIPRVDQFVRNYPSWDRRQRQLTLDWDRFQGSREGSTTISSLLFDNAINNTLARIGTAPDGTRPSTTPEATIATESRGLSAVDIMAGRSGRYIGILRRTFGTAFIRVANIYASLRSRFDQFMRDRRRRGASRGSRLAKAALQVGGAILAAIMRQIIPRVGDLLYDCLESGFRRRMDQAFSADFDAVVGDRIEEIQRRYEEISAQIEAQIDEATDRIFGDLRSRFEGLIEAWHTAGTLLEIARTAFNAARIAACVAGGLETVGIACIVAGADFILSLFDVSPSELLAASLLSTCLAQQLMAEYILSLREVRAIPPYLAGTILSFVRGNVPQEVGEMLCDEIPDTTELPDIDEVTCGEGGSEAGGSIDRWRPPRGLRSTLNRPPTAAEIEAHGRLADDGEAGADPSVPSPDEPSSPSPSVPGPEGRSGLVVPDDDSTADPDRRAIPEMAEERRLEGDTERTTCNFGVYDARRVAGDLQILVQAACRRGDLEARIYGPQWLSHAHLSRRPNSDPPEVNFGSTTTHVLERGESGGGWIELPADQSLHGLIGPVLLQKLDEILGERAE